MAKTRLPNLTFPTVHYGSIEAPIDMRWLLYRGGAKASRRHASKQIAKGVLGEPIRSRLELVQKIHIALSEKLELGGSKQTLVSNFRRISLFYKYCDLKQIDPTPKSAIEDFVEWVNYRKQQQRRGIITENEVYEAGYKLAGVIAYALDSSSKHLLRLAGLRKPLKDKRALGTEADKQHLEDTFSFGRFLLAITEQVDSDCLTGPLPVRLSFPNGQVFEHFSGALSQAAKDRMATPNSGLVQLSAAVHTHPSKKNRYPLYNLRIASELLIFISQTQMNLAQATSITVGHFIYQSHHDGYQVRRMYKGRAKGDVEFEIFSEYREHFERYLTWRAGQFPTSRSALLFPFVAPPNKTVQVVSPFSSIQKLARAVGYTHFGPRSLRGTKVNWLLRRSDDPELTAEMSQHSKQTLLGTYQRPHHQRAVTEVTRFWAQADPALRSPPGPGGCTSTSPEKLPEAPLEAPEPDCYGAAGCVFCVHNRDIDSLDHIWSLASYRHLKSLEEARQGVLQSGTGTSRTPAALTIWRLTQKLRGFESSSEVRATWVLEALERVSESDYHPKWKGFIEVAEVFG